MEIPLNERRFHCFKGWMFSTQMVWGVKGIKRSANDDPFLEDLGEPDFDNKFDLASVATQQAVSDVCEWAEGEGRTQGYVNVSVSFLL
jgi:hypothetical protein